MSDFTLTSKLKNNFSEEVFEEKMEKSLKNFRQNIRNLFIICNRLRENTTSVDSIIREIYEISLRSGISSSHVEMGKRTFNEIAKQIAKSSKTMESELKDIKSLGTEISNLSLESLKRSLQIEKMYQAQQLGCGQNETALQNAISRMESHVQENIEGIEERCKKIILLNERLTQHNQKLWNLSIHLKMEANQSGEQEEIFFSNIAQAICASNEKLIHQGKVYIQLIAECREIRTQLTNGTISQQEVLDAA